MEQNEDFIAKLQVAVNEKVAYFNSTELPKMKENYSLVQICVKNLFELLVSHGLITPDPYKSDENHENIELPEETPFKDSDISNIMGLRLSEYESILNFICNYYNFSEEFLTFEKIEKLNILNSYINWASCTPSNSKPNTKGMGLLLNDLRKKSQAVSTATLNDMLHKNAESISKNIKLLKEFSELKSEVYKLTIRKKIISNPEFNNDAYISVDDEVKEIKRLYPKIFPGQKVYTHLLVEIANEDQALNKEDLRQKIFDKLQIHEEIKTPKRPKVNSRAILMDSLQALVSLNSEFPILTEIVVNNFNILENERNNFFNKIKKFFRALFNKKDKPVLYNVQIEDLQKKSKYVQAVDMNVFMTTLERKGILYNSLADKNSSESQKINAAEDDAVLQFLSKQLSETKEIFLILTGLDVYFKSAANSKDKIKIKGLKMELLTLQNAIIKANQKRVEYCSTVEDQIKFQKLGMDI